MLPQIGNRSVFFFSFILCAAICCAQNQNIQSFNYEFTREELAAVRFVSQLVPDLPSKAMVLQSNLLARVNGKAAQVTTSGPELNEAARMLLAKVRDGKVFGDVTYRLQNDTTLKKQHCAVVISVK